MEGGCGGSCEEFEVGEGEIGDLVNAGESCLEVEGFGSLADSWEPVSGKGCEKGAFLSWCDFEVGVGFLQFGGDGRGELGGGEALGNGDFERLLDRSSEGGGGFAWVTTKLAREVEVAFVDGADFDIGGKIVGVSEHELREAFIFFEVAWDEDEIGAEAACSGGGHGSTDSAGAGFVAGGGNNATGCAADGDWFTTKPGVCGLFYGGVEGVGVEVKDGWGGWIHRERTRQVTTPWRTASDSGIGLDGLGGRKDGLGRW